MGLLSRRWTSKGNRPPSLIRRLLILAAFALFAVIFLFEAVGLASRTKTIAGHNLEPTPWHLFPPKTFLERSKYSVASKVIQCSYLSCGSTQVPEFQPSLTGSSEKCPGFFGHIHNDLEPWAKTKISQAHLAEAQKNASHRFVIMDSKLYVDLYYDCTQSRVMFTLWGLLQLLRRFPGQVPDVDLMFECMDKPSITRTKHPSMPLPLFRYCTTAQHFDIPFPDWSFWGWPEVNISPWDEEFKSIKEGSQALNWRDRIPLAYWRGNTDVGSPIRMELVQCNGTRKGTQILNQNWVAEAQSGYKESKLSNQCKHRYKIYAEGFAWSVSLKYILSCGSFPLLISPEYEDFFSRGLVHKQNYLFVPKSRLCRNIKMAVDWGNANPSQAEAIGRAAQDFMESLDMDHVYDYMYHLLREYSKLLDFTPTIPPTAMQVCMDSVLCYADEKQKDTLRRSVAVPSATPPCELPPPGSVPVKRHGRKRRKTGRSP